MISAPAGVVGVAEEAGAERAGAAERVAAECPEEEVVSAAVQAPELARATGDGPVRALDPAREHDRQHARARGYVPASARVQGQVRARVRGPAQARGLVRAHCLDGHTAWNRYTAWHGYGGAPRHRSATKPRRPAGFFESSL